MPFDVGGTFSRVYDFETDRINGIPIMSARVDGEFDGISTALTETFLRDGRVPMSNNLRMGGYRLTGLGDGTLASPAVQLSNETNTGWYRIAAGQTGFAIQGTKRLELNTTGAAVVGDLSVTGTLNVTGSSTIVLAADPYAVGWNGSLAPATKDAIYDKMETMAALASPALTGTPTAPTAAGGTNTTQIATTAFVNTAVAAVDLTAYAPKASPALTGTPTAPTAAVDTNTTQLATTAYVVGQGYAKLASPALTGAPTAPTAAVDTNTTQLATTAYVVGQGYAKLASPALTGTPTAPTAAAGTNTTQVATCAFVATAKTPSVQTVVSAATVTPAATDDMVKITAQAAALALANFSGAASEGWGWIIRIKDNGTARAITYGTKYRAIGVTLPTTTVISKMLYLGIVYNATDDKMDVVSVNREA